MPTLLFQGDSITDCSRERNDMEPDSQRVFMGSGYAAMAAARIWLDHAQDNWRIINRGISGNRVVDLYARWKIDALNLKPDLISILVGVNDSLHEVNRKNGVELPRYEKIYRMLLEWTKQELPDVKLVLCEPFSLESECVSRESYEDILARGEIVKQLAADFDATFVPLQDALNEAAALAKDNLKILRDGVHPTLAGAQIISDQWLKYVEL